MVRELKHLKTPLLGILNLLPTELMNKTQRVHQERDCLWTPLLDVNEIHKVLPPHLRDAVHAAINACKKVWNAYKHGTIRLLVVTDAAGMDLSRTWVTFLLNLLLTRARYRPVSNSTTGSSWAIS